MGFNSVFKGFRTRITFKGDAVLFVTHLTPKFWSSQILNPGSSQLNPISQLRNIHVWAYITATEPALFQNHSLVSGNTTPSDIIAVLGVKPYRRLYKNPGVLSAPNSAW